MQTDLKINIQPSVRQLYFLLRCRIRLQFKFVLCNQSLSKACRFWVDFQPEFLSCHHLRKGSILHFSHSFLAAIYRCKLNCFNQKSIYYLIFKKFIKFALFHNYCLCEAGRKQACVECHKITIKSVYMFHNYTKIYTVHTTKYHAISCQFGLQEHSSGVLLTLVTC